MNPAVVVISSIAYIVLLFLIAAFAEKRAALGKSIVNSPYVYALSLAVYCTAWTYFGSVGRAATAGVEFLPVYLGPTIVAPLWVFVLRKMILISKSQRITSIADFISSRYGKSIFLGVLCTLIAVLSIIPYISIQLKAVASSFQILISKDPTAGVISKEVPIIYDSSIYITVALAAFAILFGTRHLDPNERHEGLVAAIAFESIWKLVAFVSVGIFVVFGMYNGLEDLFAQGAAVPEIARIFSFEESAPDPWNWFWVILLSMFAILLLPRQFHMAVVENTNPNFAAQAAWVFPLYLLLINIFVIPIAVGGLLHFPNGQVDPDTFVLDLPLVEGQQALALFVAIGGFSAATSMVVVSVIAMSIMVSNNLMMPILLRSRTIVQPYVQDLSNRLIGVRRVSIVVILLLAYGFFKSVGSSYALVSIGLISFAGIAQFGPATIGALYWKRGTKAGATAGLLAGFVVWFFCLPFPTLIEAGLFDRAILEEGLFGLWWLRPYAFLGMDTLQPIAHGTFWSLFANTLFFIVFSLRKPPDTLEITQADLFVDIYKYQNRPSEFDVMRREAKMKDLVNLLNRFLGQPRVAVLMKKYEEDTGVKIEKSTVANAELVNFAETHLSGAIGAASAKVIINTVAQEDPISLEEMFKILEQTQEIVRYSKALEEKSAELENTTRQLQQANQQLQELDKLKADFITTVTHELRTPITAIKSLARIIQDNSSLPGGQQSEFLSIIVSESERVARLVNQVLELEKMGANLKNTGRMPVDLVAVTRSASTGLRQLMAEKNIDFQMVVPDVPCLVNGSGDLLTQVAVNLLSNAVKFCPSTGGKIQLSLQKQAESVVLSVVDNGVGVAAKDHGVIFEKFAQISNAVQGKPQGSGLGLAIVKSIVAEHEGQVWVESELGAGATFFVSLPLAL